MRSREYDNQIKPAIPYLFLVDNGGGQNLSGNFLTWDSIKVKTSHFTYTADDDRILLSVNISGLYKIKFECSFTDATNGGVAEISLYKNGSAISGSQSYSYAGAIGQYAIASYIGLEYIIYLERGDFLQIYGDSISGNACQTKANSNRLIIEFIPMKGWNNSHGGKTEYKGGVLR